MSRHRERYGSRRELSLEGRALQGRGCIVEAAVARKEGGVDYLKEGGVRVFGGFSVLMLLFRS